MTERLKPFRRSKRLWLACALLVLAGATAIIFLRPSPALPADATWVRIDYQTLENRLGLVGRIESAAQQTLSAPFEGVVQSVTVTEGQRIARGQTLLTLDTTLLDIQLRSALSDEIKAQRAVRELQGWANSQEVARAKRTLSTTQFTLSDIERKQKETQALFARGIVPRMEVDTLDQQLQTLRLDLAAARSELSETLKKGEGEYRQIAEMELANAQSRYQSLSALKEQRELKAPFSGVVIRPRTAQESNATLASVQKGMRVNQGMSLFELVNLEEFQVAARVEESDVHQLSEGMPVEITGDGFNGLVLQGQIRSVGARGINTETQAGGASYEVTVSVLGLQAEQQKQLRLGMSAKLEIVTYRRENALVVPADAISRNGQGEATVTYRPDPADSARPRVITTGHATPDGVEVFGLEPGYIETGTVAAR
ncbi:HlyD family efflux transporter periplasmic adaptor subunit [Pseudomonas syringae]|uniref:efflux RND transporter periplasmic adaptor subunit n=1 Tax=Pseudomonas syringae TaxID=317 RepID=UPI001CA7F40D|nr:HlyD family efflux transporter periplasmic adaptor subunit [Pseudomonas syringae]MCI3944753.1 HlyD family efflux transporter periplasmic adaptor subunit [Pseudomonas syringae]